MDKTKFYTCQQNNSGGFNCQDNNVDKWVCVEAHNVEEAQSKFEEIFSEYRDYCPCCGERWFDSMLDEDDAYDYPQIYGEHYKKFNDKWWIKGNKIITYYLNGQKEIYDLSQNLEVNNGN